MGKTVIEGEIEHHGPTQILRPAGRPTFLLRDHLSEAEGGGDGEGEGGLHRWTHRGRSGPLLNLGPRSDESEWVREAIAEIRCLWFEAPRSKAARRL